MIHRQFLFSFQATTPTYLVKCLENKKWHQPYSLIIVAIAINAALYAVGSFLTAYIPSPWGIGQFRPAVVIPSFFAVIFGPWAGGIGAALGTLIADSVKHGGLNPGSLLAAVPGNFIGFFLMGYARRKKFSWVRFITVSNIALVVSNAVVAFLYVFIYKALYAQASAFTEATGQTLIALSVGLTIFWFVTMLPFVLLLVPSFVAVVAKAFPSIVPPEVRTSGFKQIPKRMLGASMIVPGLALIAIGLIVSFVPLGGYLPVNFATSYFPATTISLIQLLLYLGGIALTILGILAVTKKET
jgi:MFS family permease